MAAFQHTAVVFIRLLDFPPDERRELLRRLERVLVELYGRALDLPPCDPSSDRAGVLPDDTDSARKALAVRLGDCAPYAEIFDPTDFAHEPGVADLADDFADIRADLLGGLSRWRDGEGWKDSAWESRFSFGSHWGRHLTSALRVLWSLNHRA